jgi:hypothetical protein
MDENQHQRSTKETEERKEDRKEKVGKKLDCSCCCG